MKSKNLLLITSILLSTLLTSPVKAQSTSCTVLDRYDTSANVRATPNGQLINALRNGRSVNVERYGNDIQGRPWAYVSGWYKGEYRYWGWIIMDSLRCY